jgi:hypothetical protein
MRLCPQTDSQSVYQHGVSVRDHIFQLIDYLDIGVIGDGWKLPDWMSEYRIQIKSKLLPKEIIDQYAVFHDCGKPYCITLDQGGKRHFPDHAEVSYHTWMRADGNEQIANLIRWDMKIHTIKSADVEEFCQHSEAITLLLAGLAEVHSNAKMFGGIQSESFKIKYGQINKRGKAICRRLFGDMS